MAWGVTTYSGSEADSPTINFGSCSAGDRLICIAIADGDGVEVTGDPGTPSGFTSRANGTSGFTHGWRVVEKISAGGSESATFNYAEDDLAVIGFKITGAHASQAIEVTSSNGSSTTPNPGNLTPSWGSDANLWIVAELNRANSNLPSAYPTNYGSNQVSKASGGSTGLRVSVAGATRELTATSEDPGTFTTPSSSAWRAFTIAVRPAASTLTADTAAGAATTGAAAGQVATVAACAATVVAQIGLIPDTSQGQATTSPAFVGTNLWAELCEGVASVAAKIGLRLEAATGVATTEARMAFTPDPDRTLAIELEDRTFPVELEARTLTIEFEDRTLTVVD